MLGSRAVSHRLELVIAVCAVVALLAVATSTRSTTQTFARGESWRHATGSLVALTAQSHAWLGEAFAGAHSIEPRPDIIAQLQLAGSVCRARRAGALTTVGRVEAVEPASRPRVTALCHEL